MKSSTGWLPVLVQKKKYRVAERNSNGRTVPFLGMVFYYPGKGRQARGRKDREKLTMKVI